MSQKPSLGHYLQQANLRIYQRCRVSAIAVGTKAEFVTQTFGAQPKLGYVTDLRAVTAHLVVDCMTNRQQETLSRLMSSRCGLQYSQTDQLHAYRHSISDEISDVYYGRTTI